jgi:hypothetical protein
MRVPARPSADDPLSKPSDIHACHCVGIAAASAELISFVIEFSSGLWTAKDAIFAFVELPNSLLLQQRGGASDARLAAYSFPH